MVPSVGVSLLLPLPAGNAGTLEVAWNVCHGRKIPDTQKGKRNP